MYGLLSCYSVESQSLSFKALKSDINVKKKKKIIFFFFLGIETATLDLMKESEEKLWQDGILRQVPVFGSLVNWWSPPNKDGGAGIKGRSLDLTAGVVASTENIYRYHMQVNV